MTDKSEQDVRSRLLLAARNCFLADEYHKVSTRKIAEAADANVAMIRYYFGNKEGLFEEMIRETLQPMLNEMESQLDSSAQGLSRFLNLYYDTMRSQPEFPKLILKVLALNQGPGRRFIEQLLERGRSQAAKQVSALQRKGQLPAELDADLLRIAFVSLAVTPMLLKDIFEQQLEREMDDSFYRQLAEFNGFLLASGLTSKPSNKENR